MNGNIQIAAFRTPGPKSRHAPPYWRLQTWPSAIRYVRGRHRKLVLALPQNPVLIFVPSVLGDRDMHSHRAFWSPRRLRT
jgi:hypothetical protein